MIKVDIDKTNSMCSMLNDDGCSVECLRCNSAVNVAIEYNSIVLTCLECDHEMEIACTHGKVK